MKAFVATQPIFDGREEVRGYDLNFRTGSERFFRTEITSEDDVATVVALLEKLAGERKAHVRFSREQIEQGVPILLASEKLTVGVPADVAESVKMLAACAEMKEYGYELSLDGFEPAHLGSDLLKLADGARVDVEAATREQQRRLCDQLGERGVRTTAVHVDTPEARDRAQEAGFTYCEGDFFRHPVLRPGWEIPANKLHYLRLLKEVNKPELAYDELDSLIRRDVAMTHRLLKFVNSVWFGLKQTVNSIRHALVLLGPPEVRTWASMLVLKDLGDEKPLELFRRCLIRAKLAEDLAPIIGMEKRASELFLVGMFSLVDALTDLSMEKALEGLALNPDIKMALLGPGGDFALAYEVICSYELGRWDSFSRAATAIDLNEQAMPALFLAAQSWADKALSVI